MKPGYITLGESIYSKIDQNEYLQKIYRTILYNYSVTLLGEPQRKKPLKKEHALKFADILSKSAGIDRSEIHRSWAQEIVSLMNAIYPDDQMVRAYASSVLATIGNYRGLQLIKTKYRNTSFLDRLYSNFDLDYLAIPCQSNKYFFHSQKEIFNHLEDEAFSYSGPTSMGKSMIMRMFIKKKILEGFKGNFAMLIPTKALISEISTTIINEDMKEELGLKHYKVVTSGNSLFLKQENLNYIMVMTPERMLYAMISYPELPIDYLFIDEAHKISSYDGRSTFYFKVIDMLMQRERKPHIILASPNIPNPDVFLRSIPSEIGLKADWLRTTFTPVSQMKYVLDTQKLEFLVFNEHSSNNDLFEKIMPLNKDDTNIDLIKKIVSKDTNKSNIVYCSGRSKAVKMAIELSRYAENLDVTELNDLANEIENEIHSDYYLANLIRRGIAYHVGYLPQHIRFKIEKLYRERKIKTIFCTSTLIEGVNLPADNLIVISCRLGRKGNMSQVEFKNLLGRVGRIEYNLYGNVFIIRDKKTSEKTLKNLLTKPIDNQKIAIFDELKSEIKKYIIDTLASGSSEFRHLKEQTDEEYNLMRKTGLILLRDITNNRNSVIRASFSSFLDETTTSLIKGIFQTNKKGLIPDDDINVSLDQTMSLTDAIENGLKYPELHDGRVDYYELKQFLYQLSRIFNWNLYERGTLGNGSSIDYYAVILVRWMNGYGLSLLLKDTIDNNYHNSRQIKINNRLEYFDNSQEHKNIVIGDTLQIIENVILFSIANYFLRFSSEYKKLKTDGKPFDNDWYEYVEYGSTNKLTIFFQRNGLSRDASDYIREHRDIYIVKTNEGYKLKKSILQCKKDAIREELNDIQYNIPELFID